MGSTGQTHVALIAFPFGTHAAPLFTVTRALAAAAPSATFSFINTARSNAALARAVSAAALANLRVYNVSDGCANGYTPSAHNPEEEVGLFLKETPGSLMTAVEEAVAGAGGVRVSCLVSDAFLWFCRKMAGEMGVPWVPLWTGGPHSLAAHVYTGFLREKIGIVGEEEEAEGKVSIHLDCIPYMSALQVGELPEGIVFGNLNSVFANLLHRMGEELPHAAAVSLNTFRGLDPALDAEFDNKFKRSLAIGPLNLLIPTAPEPDVHGCLSWLDSQGSASVVYISFGSFMSLPEPEMAELAGGLEASRATFLWSLKEAARGNLPAGFLERTTGRGLVVPWAPQQQVLGHSAIGAFLTHCGWNSVMESVTSGVPMMCRPFLGDQRLNAGVVSRVWKIGVGFEGGVVTKDAMAKGLGVILKEDEGRGMRERATKLKEMAVQAAMPGGSSTKDLDALRGLICGC